MSPVILIVAAMLQFVSAAPPSAASSPSRGRIVTIIPTPITHAEVQQYASYLQLTEAQRKYVGAMFAPYEEKALGVRRDTMLKLGPISEQLVRAYEDGSYDPHLAELHSTFVRHEVACRQAMREQEDAFFAAIERILAETQQPHLQRARAHRERRRCMVVEWEMYSAQLDLSLLIERLSLPIDVLAHMDAALREYEAAATPLMADLERLTERNRKEIIPLIVAAQYSPDGRLWQDVDATSAAAEKAKSRHRRESLLSASADVQLRLSRLNSDYSTTFAKLLPDAYRNAFVNQYQRASFPYAVYPDYTNTSNICRLLLEQFSAEVRPTADELHSRYQLAYDRTCEEMEHHYDRHRFVVASTKGIGDYPAYRDTMTRLRDERWALNEGIVKQLFSMLPADVQVAVRRDVDIYFATVADLQKRLTSGEWPGY